MITDSEIFLDTNILVYYTFKDFANFQEIKIIEPSELLEPEEESDLSEEPENEDKKNIAAQ